MSTPTPSASSALRSWQERQEALWVYLKAEVPFAVTPAVQQIHFGTVVRDATTAYEVYLTGALSELFAFYGRSFTQMGLGTWPSWAELKRQYAKCMECDIEPESIKRIRALRHVLTHRHGRVETPEERALFFGLFDPHASQTDAHIHLNRGETENILHSLEMQVCLVQSMVDHFSAGRGRSRVLSMS